MLPLSLSWVFFNTPISNHFTAANFGPANACCIHSRGSCDTRNRLNETSIPNKLGPKRVSLGPSTITTSQLPPPGEQRIRHSSTPCMLQTRLARQLQLECRSFTAPFNETRRPLARPFRQISAGGTLTLGRTKAAPSPRATTSADVGGEATQPPLAGWLARRSFPESTAAAGRTRKPKRTLPRSPVRNSTEAGRTR